MDQVQFSTANVVQEIDNVLAELNDLATTAAVGRNDFQQQLLLRTTTLLDAQAGAIWWVGPQTTMQVARHLRLDEVFPDRTAYEREAARVAAALAAETVEIEGTDPNVSALSVPFCLAGQRYGVLTVYQGQEIPGAVREGQLRFLTAVAEILVEYEVRVQQRRQLGAVTRSHALEKLVLSVHRDGSLNEVAHHIANDGRIYVGCDRVSVLVRRGNTYRALACSGTVTPERRSNLIRDLENLSAVVSRTAEPLVVPTLNKDFLPPQITGPLNTYLDRSAARSLMVVPLTNSETPREAFAAIVMEYFDTNIDGPEFLQFANTLCEHAAIALNRAATLGGFPSNLLLGAIQPWQRMFRRQYLPHWLTITALLSVVVACATMIPIEFRVTVPGTLRPTNRQYLFANDDGFVSELSVRHGQPVQTGQVVARLSSPDLELETQRVLGDLQTERQDLESIVAERLQMGAIDRSSEQRAGLLSASELSAREKIKSLEAQLQLLSQDNDRLTHRSPLDGIILDWDVDERLGNRRIRRGQRLFEIAQLDGPWHLELAIPDRRTGHILEAISQQESGLEVDFVLENQPTTPCHGLTGRVAQATQLVDGVPCVLVEVDIDYQHLNDLRPNATAVAKIHCGQRSAAFVWLHEFYEELRRRFF